MDTTMIFKALSNEARRQILEWLKHPEQHFDPQLYLPKDADFKGGICVGSIQAKTGLTQSVVSSYLSMMQKAGLLESRRYGQWTYYRRNEQLLREFTEYMRNEL
ncbi:transcriptional regulator [Paenibacillus tyrfis]|nr:MULTISPECIES: metalloregulator ArsR/SmtB family transcription factor [Paenibacillus]MBU7314545.1 helix-turn-helix domain-containing protein [Paenibacillus oleatilyticus]GLI09146.1 transcriptional regulator [Paenibacillus tyrfis]GMX67294.1 metalloregulator ArsR/SmtB family transcription factor [Paenibacillus elgii]